MQLGKLPCYRYTKGAGKKRAARRKAPERQVHYIPHSSFRNPPRKGFFDDNAFRKTFYELIRQLEERVVTDEEHKGYDAKLKISSLPDLGGAKGYCFSLCGTRFIALPRVSETNLDPVALITAAVREADDIFVSLRDTCPEGVNYTDKNGQPANAELNRKVTLSELKPRKKQGFFKSFIPQKEDSRKQKIRKIVVLIAIAVFIGALFYVLDFYIFGPMRNNAITSEIQSIAYNKKDNDGDKDKNGPAQDWDALKEINDEIVGWITIPDTVVDYPVLEHIGDDRYNQYYIDKSYKKDGTEFGSIFIDYRSTDSTKSRNVIMHGHNMRDGSQFHTMLNYSHEGDLEGDLDYYREHPVIIFNTPDGDAKYKIISVFKTSTRYEHGEFFNYMQGEFNSDAEFMNFVYNARIRSMFDIPVTVNEKDQIITLSTCCYEFYQWRCVIVARKVRPGEDEKVSYRESYQLKYIGEKVVFNPATAVVEVIKELDRMASLASENLNRAMNALITLDEEDIEEVYQVEKNINFLNHAITDYLVKINQSTLPIEDLKSIGALFHVVNDIERIGDHAENVADAAKQRKEEGTPISKEAQRELGEMLDMVNKVIQYAVDMFVRSDESHMQDIVDLESKVDEKERELQRKHVERLTRGECTPEAGMIFSDVISGLERVSDHATNIAFAITSEE